jgi:hypothetical protein
MSFRFAPPSPVVEAVFSIISSLLNGLSALETTAQVSSVSSVLECPISLSKIGLLSVFHEDRNPTRRKLAQNRVGSNAALTETKCRRLQETDLRLSDGLVNSPDESEEGVVSYLGYKRKQ